jgi:hypothetical protein
VVALTQEEASSASTAHRVCGAIVMILGILQPFNAVLRPKPTAKGEVASTARRVWEVAHIGSGYVALLLAVVTIFLGINAFKMFFANQDAAFSVGALGYGIILAALIFLAGTLACHVPVRRPVHPGRDVQLALDVGMS